MSSIPPVEKLPLAVRKDVRDNWEAKKPDWEKKISDILRTPWTIDMDVHQIYAYATDGWAKECTGSMLNAYLESAEMQLKSFIAKHGDAARTEINALAHAHQLTMRLDTDNLVSCGGSQVIPTTGQLAILVQQAKLGTNVDEALGEDSLARALSGAPAAVNEGLDSGTVAFRIVDELSDASLSCEAVLEGGVLCLQTVPGRFGTNMEQVADKLMERL
ncbi:hypothetical protein E4U43_000720 [Claviceps pusilla]|uniref:Uncharacterized protein n=1 Tax=Claviceps pusilla TaxID=123648 RepID=A0A9P7SZX5_9HYPO|nr:hypothetical protein E4U43_000720 [Claviceps pusilla]